MLEVSSQYRSYNLQQADELHSTFQALAAQGEIGSEGSRREGGKQLSDRQPRLPAHISCFLWSCELRSFRSGLSERDRVRPARPAQARSIEPMN